MGAKALTAAYRDRVVAALVLACGGVVVYAAYRRWIRPWHLRWGATEEEVARSLPADDRIPRPDIVFTRAITIDTPPSAVWPWIVQMGYRRAGWYSYDRLDNDGVHVRRIIPELQRLEVGDLMRTGPDGGFRVDAIEPERCLVLMIDPSTVGRAVEISCVICLEPVGTVRTRLLLRARAAFNGPLERAWGRLLFDAGDFVMMRRMLLGIRERAERAWSERSGEAALLATAEPVTCRPDAAAAASASGERAWAAVLEGHASAVGAPLDEL